MKRILFVVCALLALYRLDFQAQAELQDRPLSEIPYGTELIIRYPVEFEQGTDTAVFSDTLFPWKRFKIEEGTPYCAIVMNSKEAAKEPLLPSRTFKVAGRERYYDRKQERFTATLMKVRELDPSGNEIDGPIRYIRCESSKWELTPEGNEGGVWVKGKSYRLKYYPVTVKEMMNSFGKYVEVRSGDEIENTPVLK